MNDRLNSDVDTRVVMVAVIGFCVFLDVYATQALLPLFRTIFHASEFTTSLTVSATTIAIALASPFAGLLGEHLGRRRTMVLSVSLLTIPVLLSATSSGLHGIIAWRFAQGLLMPGIIAVTIAYITEEWSSHHAPAVMSAYVAGNVLGGVCGRVMSGMIADHYGWRWAFVSLGVLNAIGAAAVWRWLPESRCAPAPQKLRASLRDMAGHFHKPVVVATFFVATGTLFALVATFSWITFYLAAPPFGLRTSALGMMFLVYIVGVIVTPVAGRWISRLGHRTAYVLSAVATGIGVALTLVHLLPVVLAGLAICSTGVFICQSAAASYVGHVAGKARSSAAGLYAMFYYAGGTAGAALPAITWKLGQWPGCVALTLIMLAGAIALVLAFWKPAGDFDTAPPVPVGE